MRSTLGPNHTADRDDLMLDLQGKIVNVVVDVLKDWGLVTPNFGDVGYDPLYDELMEPVYTSADRIARRIILTLKDQDVTFWRNGVPEGAAYIVVPATQPAPLTCPQCGQRVSTVREQKPGAPTFYVCASCMVWQEHLTSTPGAGRTRADQHPPYGCTACGARMTHDGIGRAPETTNSYGAPVAQQRCPVCREHDTILYTGPITERPAR